jgi:two-component system, chemotaxis family, sensor kinase CheA
MPNEELLRELLGVFGDEAEERLETADALLLEIERSDDATGSEAFAKLLREMHTLKGSAAAVSLDDVSTVAHDLETFFARMRDGEIGRAPESLDVGYHALEAMRAMIRAAVSGRESGVDVAALRGRLGAVPAAGSGPEAEPPPAAEQEAGPVADAPAATPSPATEPAAPAERETVAAVAASGGGRETVRIATSKLDDLMAQVGELLITTMAREERRTDLRDVLDSLGSWADGWKKARPERDRIDAYVAEARTTAIATTTEELDRLTELGRMVEFLRDGESRLEDVHTRLIELDRTLTATDRRTRQATADLQDEVLSVRMLPVSAVFDSLPRLVRELGRGLGKEASLEIVGGETEVDRAVLEQMRGPLTHLIRNALDHGLETPDVRERAGKPRAGTISVSASQRGGTLVVELRDDGAGIDAGAVKAVALARGVIGKTEAASMSARDAVALIFRPGLSTSQDITDLSGRGVGLDVVHESVERLQGTVEVDSRPGEGTTFTLTLPVTVATTQCLLVRAAGQTFGLPLSGVGRILRIRPTDAAQNQGRRVVLIDDEPVVVTSLASLLGVDREDAPWTDVRPAVLLYSSERRVAALVDGVLGSPEVVVKNLPPPLVRVPGIGGATILGSGETILVLSAADLVKAATGAARTTTTKRAPARVSAPAAPAPARGTPVVVVADDSVVSRMLEKGVLEAAGFEVRAAADGLEAWEILSAGGCSLLVSDVNMPGMDGLQLTARLRADARFRDFPVILVTSLDSPEDRARGVEVGADAYIVKSTFSRNGLLEAVRRLI